MKVELFPFQKKAVYELRTRIHPTPKLKNRPSLCLLK